MIPADLLELLCCPVSRQPLRLADEETLRRLNARLANPEPGLRNVVGQRVTAPLEAALIREDGAVAYPVRDGIPVLLADEGVPVG